MGSPNRVSDAVVARFRSGATARLGRLETAWAKLAENPRNAEAAATLRRELHTLKGDARLVGYRDVDVLCHKVEDLIEIAGDHRFHVPPEFDLIITMAWDFMSMIVRHQPGAALGGLDLPGFISQVEQLAADLAEEPVPTSSIAAPPLAQSSVIEQTSERLGSDALGRLAITATTLRLLACDLAGDQAARTLAAADAIVGEIDRLTSARLGPEIEQRVASIQEVGASLGKNIAVSVELDEIRVPRDVGEAVGVAILHALRNAIDHGIERSEVREAAGKSARGQLRVGSRVYPARAEISIADDGRGIDVAAVRARAMHVVPKATVRAMDDAAAAQLIFLPGLTTTSEVSETSGRGVGLDAARDALLAVGGDITVTTVPGRGTRLVIDVPRLPRTLEVKLIQSARGDVVYAFAASVTIAPAASAKDALVHVELALGLAEGTPGQRTTLSTPAGSITIATGPLLGMALAERPCPTPPTELVEVMRVAGADVIFIRDPLRLRP